MKKIIFLIFLFTWAKLYAQPANSLLQKNRNYTEAINETYSIKKDNSAKINDDAALKEQAAKWLSTKNEKGFLENRGQMMDMEGNPVPKVLFKTEAPNIDIWVTDKGLVLQTLNLREGSKTEAEHTEPDRK